MIERKDLFHKNHFNEDFTLLYLD